MRKFIKIFLFVFLLLVAGILLLFRYPTPEPTVHLSFAPKADLDRLPPLKITWIPTGDSVIWEPILKSGGALGASIKMVYGGILVQHPKGAFLIDGGLGKDVREEMTHALGLLSKFFNLHLGTSIIQQKEKFPALNEVQFIFLTHSHFDHLSGAKDFPGVPIYMLPEEIQFIPQASQRIILPIVFPENLEALQSRFKPIELKDQPYENFAKSLDWFGDGSVVLVPLPGHTPGSLGIFLNLSPTRRFLVIGDAAWFVNDRGEPEARSLPAEWFADNDPPLARKTVAQLRELIKNSKEITLVPVHDEKALQFSK